MRRVHVILGIFTALVTAAGCDMSVQSSPGISLPEGNAEAGQTAFVALQCTSCHRVKDLNLPPPETEGPDTIVLGGGVTRVRSYGDLVTSIINPSHRLAKGFAADRVSQEGQSLMTVYNDVMTVSQMIDIVAFLQSRYEKIERPGYRYPKYDYDKGG